MITEIMTSECAKLSFSIPSDQIAQLAKLVQLLDKWNKAYNLTSVRDPEQMVTRHILDSLVVSPYLRGKRFIDVGTGPGLPGLPLAIINPDREFVLLDSLGKRIRFIRQVLFELGITNVTPVQSRVELYQPEQPFDGVLSRAFASLTDMLEWCHHLTDQNGQFLALKGSLQQTQEEIIPDGFALESLIPLTVPGLDEERHLAVIVKSV